MVLAGVSVEGLFEPPVGVGGDFAVGVVGDGVAGGSVGVGCEPG